MKVNRNSKTRRNPVVSTFPHLPPNASLYREQHRTVFPKFVCTLESPETFHNSTTQATPQTHQIRVSGGGTQVSVVLEAPRHQLTVLIKVKIA